MKGNFIAAGAGGALIVAAALVGLAGPASAAQGDLCVSDVWTTLKIDKWGVQAGRRDAGACDKHDGSFRKQKDDQKQHEFDRDEKDFESHDQEKFDRDEKDFDSHDFDRDEKDFDSRDEEKFDR
ncbi:hypothetical protein ABZ912_19645, partial [Nonomuraea angiospora]|uniref:hypothetical protein n=1 Tax=Nonomuraea angiospora TaxID=46172 RepID=UPI0033CC9414